MEFVRITRDEDDQPVYINPKHVVAVMVGPDVVRIDMSDGAKYRIHTSFPRDFTTKLFEAMNAGWKKGSLD